MGQIKAADVAKLRKATGAGMMDCKNALTEVDGDFQAAIDLLRKKGQKVANKRADRDATEGAALSIVSADNKTGIVLVLNCETDFVAKNEDFVAFVRKIGTIALDNKAADVDALKALPFGEVTVGEEIITQIGVIGEKLDLSGYALVEAETVVGYIHPGNKLASMAGFNVVGFDEQTGKDVVMQIAAMSPIAIDKEDVSEVMIAKEIEIGKEQAIAEGKPAQLAEKIALGKLNKFYKENTLMQQQFVKNNKITISEHVKAINKDAKVVVMKRFGLNA